MRIKLGQGGCGVWPNIHPSRLEWLVTFQGLQTVEGGGIHTGKDMSSLALVAGFLTSHWTEAVIYFRRTFCVEIGCCPREWWFCLVFVLGFFLIHVIPSLALGPGMGILIKKQNQKTPQKTQTTKKPSNKKNQFLIGDGYHLPCSWLFCVCLAVMGYFWMNREGWHELQV